MFPNHFCFEITIITIVTIILYIPKEHEHVAQGKNINNVVVSSGEYWVCEDFVHVKNSQKWLFVHILST